MRFFIFIALLCVSIVSQAQNKSLEGIVKDTKGEPLPQANIVVVSVPGKGASTNLDGAFSISGLSTGQTLRVSFIGYKTQDFVFRGQPYINIILEDDNNLMDDMVVIGYGTQTKKDLTGALSTVSSAELSSQPSMNVASSLQGKVAGLQIVNSGAPGSAPLVRIRGTGTLLGGADPLYVVDGVFTSDIRNVSNSDIKSVEVLKDASSAAIYGVRAANGVIIITTFKGIEGSIKVSYNAYMGFNTVQSKVKMADSKLYATYTNEALGYEGQDPIFLPGQKLDYNTKWLDEISHSGKIQEHSVSVSGGSSAVKYYGSASYYQNNGILQGNGYERLTVRLSNDYTLSKYFDAGLNVGLSTFRSDNVPYSAFNDAYRSVPVIPARYPDGTYAYFPDTNVGNPLATINYTHDKGRGVRVQGNAYLVAKPFKGFSFRSQISLDWSNNNGQIYNPVYHVSSAQKNEISKLSLNQDRYLTWIWDNIITYDVSSGKNKFTFTLGMTSEEQSSASLSASRQNVPPDEKYWTLGLGDISTAENGSGKGLSRRTSYLGRIFYSWDGKYLVTATARMDGSSRFPKDNRFAFFPSIGLGWRISQEDFMQDSRVVSNLKLRASWGQLGNDAIGADSFVYTITSGLSYVLGDEQVVIPGGTVTDIKDPNLKWETTSEWDLGADFGFFSDRLYGSIDYYRKQTNNALILAPVDAVFGDPDGAYLTNKADIRNSGLEFIINWSDDINTNWKYNLSLNSSYNHNQITNVADGIPIVSGFLGNGQLTTRTQLGKPVGAFWVYQTDGIFNTQAELDKWIADSKALVPGTKVGDLKYIDRDNNGEINDNDKYSPGAYAPKFTMGINIGINYRNWDFSTEIYGVFGNMIYNGNMALRFGNENIQQSLSDRWTSTNTSTNTPRASNAIPLSSDYYLQSGDYIKFNTFTVGYSLPETTVKKIGMTKLRMYLSALNPFVIKKYNGFSAELPAGALNSGVDLNAFPQVSSFIFGLNVNF